MRRYSTRESIDRGEVSIFAIVETLLAVSLLVVLSLWFDTARWLAGAVCIAPLLLLRTEDSVQRGLRGLRWYKKRKWLVKGLVVLCALTVFALCIWLAGWWSVLIVPVFIVPIVLSFMAPLCLCLRFGATLVSVMLHPLASIGAIPGNWRRFVLATDSATPPEFLPGDSWGSKDLLSTGRGSGLLLSWCRITGFIFLYPPTAAYRWSVKATSLIYFPLIWLLQMGQHKPSDVRLALDDYQADDIKRIGLVVSVLLLAALTAKVMLMLSVAEFVAWWNGNAMLQFLKILVVPHEIPIWQVASALNSLLALSRWIYARKMKRRYDTSRAPSESTVLAIWRTATVVSAVLTFYTIACTMLIIWHEGDLVETLRRLCALMGRKLLP